MDIKCNGSNTKLTDLNISYTSKFTLFFLPSEKDRLIYIGDALSETIEAGKNSFNLYFETRSFLEDFIGRTVVRLTGEDDLILNVINTKIPFDIFEQIITKLEDEVSGITFSLFGYNEYSTHKGNDLLFDINKFKKIKKFIISSEIGLKKIIQNPKYKFVKNYVRQSNAKKIDRQSIAALSKKIYQATTATEYPKIQFHVDQQHYSVPNILNIVSEFSFETNENLCILSLLYAYFNFLVTFEEKLEKEKNKKDNTIYSNDNSFSRKQKTMRKHRQSLLLKDVNEIKINILQYYHLLSKKIGYNHNKSLSSITHYFSRSHHIFYNIPSYRLFTIHIKSWLEHHQSLEKESKTFVSLQNVNLIYEIYILYITFQSVIEAIHSKQKNNFQILWENDTLKLYGNDIDCDVIYNKTTNEALPKFIDRLGTGKIQPDIILKFKHHQSNKETVLIIDAKSTSNPIYPAKELTWKYLYRLFPKQENTIIAGLIIASPLLTSDKKNITDVFKNWATKDNVIEYSTEQNALCFGNQNINMPYIQIIKSIPTTLHSFKEQIKNLVLWIQEDNKSSIPK